jgi:NAD(P)H-dependent FMN reductase
VLNPILIVSGTNRPGANALKVARILESLYRTAGAEAEIYSLEAMPREIFDPASYATKPAAFAEHQRKVLDSVGLHVVVPEYNGGFPGVLKYWIDMLKFPESFERRPVAFVGEAAGVWGAIRAVEQLQQIFGYRNGYIYPDRVFIPQVHQKLDAEGKLTVPDIQQRLEAQVRGFIAFVRSVKG